MIEVRMRHGVTALALSCALLGCQGGLNVQQQAGDAPASDPQTPVTPIEPDKEPVDACAPQQPRVAKVHARKLSRVEYTHALEKHFPKEAVKQASGLFGLIPEDDPSLDTSPGNFERAITKDYAQSTLEISSKLASIVARDQAILAKIGPACLLNEPDMACVESFVRAFGATLTGAALDEEQVDQYKALWSVEAEEMATSQDRIEVVLGAMLNAPEFVWHLPEVDARHTLTQRAIAQRLSWASWGAGPDEALMEDAAQGALTDPTVREGHARRLLNTPQGRKFVRAFFARWFDLIRSVDLNKPAEFAGMNVDGLYDDMAQEMGDFVEHLVFEQDASYLDLMTSNLEFPSTDALAKIMGHVAPSQQAVASTTGRHGLLTRPAVLVHVNDRPAIIHRAVHVLYRALCIEDLGDNIPVDANDVANDVLGMLEDTSTLSARQLAAQVTSAPACAGCHAIINPLGFATSGFGALGEAWEIEKVYAIEDMEVQVLNEHEIDATALLLLDGQQHQIDGPRDLGARIASSAQGQQCAAKQVFRISHLREPSDSDACHVAGLEQAFKRGDSMLEIFVQNAAHESIQTKLSER